MWKDFEATGIGITIGVMVFLIVNVAIGRDILPRAEREFVAIESPEIDLDPNSLYSGNCAMCHQADGSGMAGQFPPLVGSHWVTEDPETPLRLLLVGISGEIEVEGETFNGVMPAQGHLNNEQLAVLANHIRTSWGNEAEVEITPELVEEVRTSLAGRTTAVDGGAELTAMRAAP